MLIGQAYPTGQTVHDIAPWGPYSPELHDVVELVVHDTPAGQIRHSAWACTQYNTNMFSSTLTQFLHQ